jgi:hypothetical protein
MRWLTCRRVLPARAAPGADRWRFRIFFWSAPACLAKALATAGPRAQQDADSRRARPIPTAAGLRALLRPRTLLLTRLFCVAQVSKPAVPQTSKSASGQQVWKPATQQVWKPALQSRAGSVSSSNLFHSPAARSEMKEMRVRSSEDGRAPGPFVVQPES